MVTPTAVAKKKTHHITLAAGGTTVGLVLCDAQGNDNEGGITQTPYRRMPLKMQQGDSEWSDFELPYQNVGQDDWSGGVGLLDDTDRTRYWHGYMINTMHKNKAFLGPLPHITSGYRTQAENWLSGSTQSYWLGLYGTKRYQAIHFNGPTGGMTGARVEIMVKKVGTPNGDITVELWTQNGGDPDAIIAGATDTDSDAQVYPQAREFDMGTPPSLTVGTSYYVVAYGHASDDVDNHWAVCCHIASSEYSADGSTWTADLDGMHYRVTEAQDPFMAHLFNYRGAEYFVTRPDDGATPKFYINGIRGESIGSSTATTLEHTGATWGNNDYQNMFVMIVGGTGLGQTRKIASNDADTLTVDTAWETTPDATSEYVILGSNEWTEIGTTGLTGPVTDVKVVRNVVYFCQGEAVNIRRFNYDANTNSFADDGTNKGSFMELVHEGGGAQVYVANNAATSVTVTPADPQSWGTSLTLGTAIACGNSEIPITGLERYFDPEYLIVKKQDQIGRIVSGEYQTMPLREMAAMKSEKSGAASTVGNLYLYFNLKNNLERYHQGRLDDVGPNLDDGLPEETQGPVLDLMSFPGRIYAALGAVQQSVGVSPYSSIMVHNGLGWHPWYRAHFPSNDIKKMDLQIIPESDLDRLWISEGSDVYWLSMPSETADPSEQDDYDAYPGGYIETSWYYLKLRDIAKTFNSVNIWAEELSDVSTASYTIFVEYKIDEGAWTLLSEVVDTSPGEELDISTASSQVQGRRIKFRIHFATDQLAPWPILKAMVLEAVAHIPTKYTYSTQCRIRDNDPGLAGITDSISAATKIAQLKTWANAGTQLTMRHHDESGPYDDKAVFVGPPSSRPYYIEDALDLVGYICNVEIFEA